MAKPLVLRALLPEHRELSVTREQITLLMLESHKKAVNATEEIMALREIAKIHNMYTVKPLVQINVMQMEKDVKKLETMSDQMLLEMAGKHPGLFKFPTKQEQDEGYIEADFKEVKDE